MVPVVLALEVRVWAAAAVAVAAPDDPRFKRCRTFNSTGDFDLDDDFPAPAPRAFSHTPTTTAAAAAAASQQTGFGGFGAAAGGAGGFGFSSQAPHAMGPPVSKSTATAAAAAGSAAAAGPSYANLVTGGLAGFSGRVSKPWGSKTLAPALAAYDPSYDAAAPLAINVSGPQAQGFALGGLSEGLAGVAGVEGAGLRVLAALSPACGPDAAQGLLQLWRTVSGAAGGAPSEQLLEALVETMCIAVCSGGWAQLGQLLGLMRGSHTLLAAQKPPLSTLHLLLRLLQAVAAAAGPAGVRLGCMRDAFVEAAVSQGSLGVLDSQQQQQMEVDGGGGVSMLAEMMEIFKDVYGRLSKLRKAAEQSSAHNPLPGSTQPAKSDATAAKAAAIAAQMKLSSKLITHSGKRALLNWLFSMALPSAVTATTPQQQQQKQRQQINSWFDQAAARQSSCLFYPQPLVTETFKIFAMGVCATKFKQEQTRSMTAMQQALLSSRALQQVLLNMHRNIAAAGHPMHKLQRLGQLEALMHLLDRTEAASPALARYLAAAVQPQQLQHLAQGNTGVLMALQHLGCQVYFQLASYADQRFKEIEAQMASPEWQKQKQVLEYKEGVWRAILQRAQELRRLPPAKQGSQTVQAEIKQLNRNAGMQRQVIADKEIVQQVEANRAACLRTALSSYRLCIATGNTHDLQVVYRLCGLWFKLSSDASVNGALGDVFSSVPSAKFVPLVYQMASRLDSSEGSFQAVLKTALSRLMREHPYHTLYSLIALRNGDVDGGAQVQTDQGKAAAAAALLEELRGKGPPGFTQAIDDMVTQVQVFIELEKAVKVPRNAQGRVLQKQTALPGCVRRRLLAVQHAPPICINLPLDPSCQYEDIPHVTEVDSVVDLPGGINVPMVVRTTDSAGNSAKQLVKSGNDDLRQDAVMQQFFGLINDLLSSSPASQQRQLSLRTYRVVPCSPKVGVVQWVDGTQPVGDYLSEGAMKEGGACARYRKPGNMTWFECHQRMNSSKPEQLKDNLLYCMAHFPPVFHNFFLERFPQPSAWFTARTAYTRSTAVNSMAGAVIGLGDRHLNNVLVDLATAEVLHIDLGIAFEQGMFLSTPERVPFRLTANVVDGMGAAGLEGTFRRCCETTLQALRSHKEALLTVVEVVLHDPMYKWQMTPVKAQRRQQDPIAADGGGAAAATPAGPAAGAAAASSGAASSAGGPAGSGAAAIGNADAERAVLRVKQKLEGQDVEGGVAMSVAAQVGKWLQDAQDPDRLCRMFVGWAAWQ
ncbi:hypothetical protein OEZ85_005192 [Tetradesmus obliquus]|uniref:non-specific serine/threonine protein kinase n=1 Tax=Tetradesmus obliquus TaxID=3088 RepID=A0ABY8UKD6_TETOB|nr:hypothetical protein OEZ85_005192 [Tetradesmus obliquus]